MGAIHATPEIARELEAHLRARLDFRVHEKEDDPFMSVIGAGLDAFGILGRQRFVRDFATTLGADVWIPDRYSPEAAPFARMKLLVHEATHVVRYRRGKVRFASLYIRHGESRAHEEAIAYSAGAEFEVACTGALPALDDIGASLTGGGCASCAGAYGLDAGERAFARGLIEQGAASIAAGVHTSEVALEAIGWLRANAPQVLHGGA
ncbi:DUF4157 domain-containing protein [Myxococcota bacterium]|nr:DUF4157 domain-containing protein [Myxococcota bacterium]